MSTRSGCRSSGTAPLDWTRPLLWSPCVAQGLLIHRPRGEGAELVVDRDETSPLDMCCGGAVMSIVLSWISDFHIVQAAMTREAGIATVGSPFLIAPVAVEVLPSGPETGGGAGA